MKIIEPHIHMYSRTTDDYQAMYEAGIRACVEPSFWLGSERRYAGTFYDYFLHILDFETQRAERFGIDHYAAISVNPKEAENIELANEVLDGMEEYLDHPRCVALGEIGLNENTENELEVFRRQLLLAEQREMPVIVHLPHVPKTEGARIIVDVIESERITQERILIDHNDEESMPVSRQTNCFCGMTVYPYSKLSPERVSELIGQYGAERMMVAGSADWGVSDPISLVRVVERMRGDGHPDQVIQKLVHDNPMELYGHSSNWEPRLDIKPVPVSEFQR
ncbi:MAG: TatD family hydrolase [Candidatus Brocadiia bacterium]